MERDFYAVSGPVYATSHFADGLPGLWWIALERALTNSDSVKIRIGSDTIEADCRSLAAKKATFVHLRNALVAEDSVSASGAINQLCSRHAIDYAALTSKLCMSWEELKQFSCDPLVTIGSHALTYGNIAKMTADSAKCEIFGGRDRLQSALQKPVLHMAYPYGDRNAAGPREFALASQAGFLTAVTTRPGMIFPENIQHMTALPRVSVNGNFQDERFLPVLTSGTATAVWNGFRRVSV